MTAATFDCANLKQALGVDPGGCPTQGSVGHCRQRKARAGDPHFFGTAPLDFGRLQNVVAEGLHQRHCWCDVQRPAGDSITRLVLAGCTEAEIGTITGHSLRDVRSILDAPTP